MYVMIDCGGFKRIMSTDRPNSIQKIQDDFRNATIEGDEFGRATLYSGDEIAAIVGGDTRKEVKRDVLAVNVKPAKRRI